MNNETIDRYLASHDSVSELVQQREGVWTFEFDSISAYTLVTS